MQGENILSHKAAAPRLWVYLSWVAQEQVSSSATSTPPFLPHPVLIPTATKKSSLILPPKETWNIFPAESQLTYWLDNPTGQKKACFIPLFSESSPKNRLLYEIQISTSVNEMWISTSSLLLSLVLLDTQDPTSLPSVPSPCETCSTLGGCLISRFLWLWCSLSSLQLVRFSYLILASYT